MRKRTPPGPLTFEAFGVPVQLSLSDRELEEHAIEVLPPGWSRCEPSEAAGRFALRKTGDDSYEVAIGSERWLEYAELEVAIGMLDAQIRLFVAAGARDLIFVHAGVVARNGKALIVPGKSFSGKTTLVAALVQAGATYYSDEYAVLDADGRVHPYPRRLSIRSDDGTQTQRLHAGELGGHVARESAELAVVVVTRYRPGGEWKPERLSRGAGVLALLENTVPAQERPQESLRVLRRAVAATRVLESDRGEAGPTAAALLDELAD
jgi:hypothetical protein